MGPGQSQLGGEGGYCTFEVIVLCKAAPVSTPGVGGGRPVLDCAMAVSIVSSGWGQSRGSRAEGLLLTPGAIVANVQK